MNGVADDSARMGTMRLFNTAAGQLDAVSSSGPLGVYVCGITPYTAAHIGHAIVYILSRTETGTPLGTRYHGD